MSMTSTINYYNNDRYDNSILTYKYIPLKEIEGLEACCVGGRKGIRL